MAISLNCSLFNLSLKSHQLSHLRFFSSCLCTLQIFLFSNSSSASISHILPLLHSYYLSGCFLPFSPTARLISCSPVHLCSLSSCVTVTGLLSLCELACEHMPFSANVDFHSNHEPGSTHKLITHQLCYKFPKIMKIFL